MLSAYRELKGHRQMDSKRKIVPVNASRDFFINELFFSTTTHKGIIVSGNEVFTRVSHYPLEQMIGQPHNLIRHPEMPRTVFKLLWDYLLAGKSIAAYVKNMASDGRYYWVVALATPIEGDGFLSVRFKPSSQLFALILGIYGELRTIEQMHEKQGDGPKAGMHAAGAKLGEILQAKGFADYDAFMQALLYQELNSRDGILAREHLTMFPPLTPQPAEEDPLDAALRMLYQDSQQMYQQINGVYAQLDEYVHRNEELCTQSRAILSLTREFQLICLNLSVASSRLANAGHTLTVISAHLREASSWIASIVSGLAAQAAKISQYLGQTVFGLAWARLQFEMVIAYYREFLAGLADPDNKTQPTTHLSRLADLRFAFCKTMASVERSLQDLSKELKGLNIEVEELRKAMLSLQVTYVGGLVEASRLTENGVFTTIFHDIQKHMDDTKMKLDMFDKVVRALDTLARQTPKIMHIASCAGDQMRRDQERLAAIVGHSAPDLVVSGALPDDQRTRSSSTEFLAA